MYFEVFGQIQGVGFRPFVKNLADSLSLTGTVVNTIDGVRIEANGDEAALATFYRKLQSHAGVESIKRGMMEDLPDHRSHCTHHVDFQIITDVQSTAGINSSLIPDRNPCTKCQQEMLDPGNIRYLYPFTSCTQCGPRYAIAKSAPFDRGRTSFGGFSLCHRCQAEYTDSGDRRFHAQTVCCPGCGPELRLLAPNGQPLATENRECFRQLVSLLKQGHMVALKGTCGFHFIADPHNPHAVAHIRRLKARPEKPLALLYLDIEAIKKDCLLDNNQTLLLKNSAGPLVLLEAKPAARKLFADIAPDNAYLAVMLPANGISFLLQHFYRKPLIATSANRKNSALIGDIDQLLDQFSDEDFYILDHNLVIQNPIDDSITQIVERQPMILRLARGYTPKRLPLPDDVSATVALGALLKNHVAIAKGRELILSPYFGNLQDHSIRQKRDFFCRQQTALLTNEPHIITDQHPDFPLPEHIASARVTTLQHHISHSFACEFEHQLQPPYLSIVWDGLGFAGHSKPDHTNATTFWGGEFFVMGESGYRRLATFKPLSLLGGDLAIKEPRRMALALLLASQTPDSEFNPAEFIATHWQAGWQATELNLLCQSFSAATLQTSAVGRLLDGIASLLNLCHANSHEGQAPMHLQSRAQYFLQAEKTQSEQALPYQITECDELLQIDWRETVVALVEKISAGKCIDALAYSVLVTLANIAVEVILRSGLQQVALSGGCFQNKLLVEMIARQSLELGVQCFWPQQLPPNDSAIAVGQILAAIKQHKQHKQQQGRQHRHNQQATAAGETLPCV